MTRPDSKSSNVTAQPPQTAPNVPTDSQDQNPSPEGTSKKNPHHSKTSQFTLAPYGLKQEKCQGTSLN